MSFDWLPFMDVNLYREIVVKSRVELRPATQAQLQQLMELRVPEEAIRFYREPEPTRYAEIARVRLLPIKHVVEENTDYVPGCYVQPHGYVVFLTTIYGDTYCFDLNSANSTASAPVVLLSHEIFDETTTKEQVSKVAKKIASQPISFSQCLCRRRAGYGADLPRPGILSVTALIALTTLPGPAE